MSRTLGVTTNAQRVKGLPTPCRAGSADQTLPRVPAMAPVFPSCSSLGVEVPAFGHFGLRRSASPNPKPLSGSTDWCAVGSEASQLGSTLQPRGCSLINLTIADLEDQNEVWSVSDACRGVSRVSEAQAGWEPQCGPWAPLFHTPLTPSQGTQGLPKRRPLTPALADLKSS